MIMIEPSTHAKIATGPAMWVALNAPNSHPEPMIEPTPAKSRPTGPTCRRSPLVASSAAYSTRRSESALVDTAIVTHLLAWGVDPHVRWH